MDKQEFIQRLDCLERDLMRLRNEVVTETEAKPPPPETCPKCGAEAVPVCEISAGMRRFTCGRIRFRNGTYRATEKCRIRELEQRLQTVVDAVKKIAPLCSAFCVPLALPAIWRERILALVEVAKTAAAKEEKAE